MPRQATADHLQPRATLRFKKRGGFTLAELLVVVGIIVLLISILIPVVARVRIAGQTADTASLIRAIDAACQTYYQDHQAWPGILPPTMVQDTTVDPPVYVAVIGPGTTARYRDGAGQLQDIVVEVAPSTGFAGNGATLENVTESENLVLSLLGGLRTNAAGAVVYDPSHVGRGAVKLGGRTPGGFAPYADLPDSDLNMHVIGDKDTTYAGASIADRDSQLRWGRFADDATAARDSLVPEFLDRYSAPLPILFMRANAVTRITEDKLKAGAPDGTNGKIIATDDPVSVAGVFNQLGIAGYVGPTGTGSGHVGGRSPQSDYFLLGTLLDAGTIPPAPPYFHGLQVRPEFSIPNPPDSAAYLRRSMEKGSDEYTYPYDARAYLLSPDSVNARQSDRYVIISAGADRIYGTEDDITSFGSVR